MTETVAKSVDSANGWAQPSTNGWVCLHSHLNSDHILTISAAGHQFNLSEAPPNGPGLTKGQQFQIGNCWELAPGVLEPDLIDRDQMWTFDPAGGTAVYQCLQIGENRPTLVLLQVYGPPSQAEGGKQAEVSDEIHKEDVKQELQAEA